MKSLRRWVDLISSEAKPKISSALADFILASARISLYCESSNSYAKLGKNIFFVAHRQIITNTNTALALLSEGGFVIFEGFPCFDIFCIISGLEKTDKLGTVRIEIYDKAIVVNIDAVDQSVYYALLKGLIGGDTLSKVLIHEIK